MADIIPIPSGTSLKVNTDAVNQLKSQEYIDAVKAEMEKEAKDKELADKKLALDNIWGTPTDTNSTTKTDWKAKIAADQALYDDFKQLFIAAGLKGDISLLLIAYQASKVAEFDLQIDKQQAALEELQSQQQYINNLNVRVQGFAEKGQNYMTTSSKTDVKDTTFADISALMNCDPSSIQTNRDSANVYQEGLNLALGIFNTEGTQRTQEMVNWNDTKAWADFKSAHSTEADKIFNLAKDAGTKYHGMIEWDIGKASDSVTAIINGLRSSADATEEAISAAGTGFDLKTLNDLGPKYGYSQSQLEALYKDDTGKYSGLTNALTNIAKGIDNDIQNATTNMSQLVSRENALTDVLSNVLKSMQSAEQTTGRDVS